MNTAEQIIKAFTDRCGVVAHAALTDLRKSGLSDETILSNVRLFNGKREDLKKELGYSSIDGTEIIQNCQLIEFPYRNKSGEKEFSRFKPVPQLDPQKKYLHPFGAPAIPFITAATWSVYLKASQAIWITEGEKKALKIEQEGRHCIALPGIWGFKAGKNSRFEDGSKQLWKQLRDFDWAGRSVFLAFDSDLWTNQQVRYALYELAIKLIALGAIVKFPFWDEGKGIDDYLMSQLQPKKALLSLEESAKDIGDFVDPTHQKEVIRAISVGNLSPVAFEQIISSLAKKIKVPAIAIKKQIRAMKGNENGGLDDFFQRFALIYGTTFVFDCKEKISMETSALGLAFPDLYEMWRQSPNKRIITANKIVFKPHGCSSDEINLFDRLDFKAVHGSCEKILELTRHLTNNDPDLFHWLIRWMAYPLQNLGAKMKTSVVFHGGQGVGKNLLFEMYGKLFGQYYSYVTQDVLDEIYTDWASGKLFILCDEVLANRSKGQKKNVLKSYVTQDEISIRCMYMPRRKQENHCNFVFLSNDSLPILIDPDDRRYTIIQVHRPLPKDFYNEVVQEIENGGREAFTYFLLHYDLGDFGEHSPFYETDAKFDLAAQCEDGFDRFLKLWQDGQTDLPFCTCTISDLYQACSLWIKQNNEYLPGGSTAFGIRLKTLMERDVITGCVTARISCHGKQSRALIVDGLPDGFERNSVFGDNNAEIAAFFKTQLLSYVEALSNIKP